MFASGDKLFGTGTYLLAWRERLAGCRRDGFPPVLNAMMWNHLGELNRGTQQIYTDSSVVISMVSGSVVFLFHFT